jgi:two-component system cell cycle sensor histidine kinase/response regulator CckA
VAHEFNNMLTPMLVHVQSVADSLSDRPELREELGRVEHAIESAAGLVSRIVQMSKPSADRLEPGRLSEIVEETVAFLGKTLDRRIQVQTRFEPEPGQALLSRSGVTQVLINLIINAKDAALERAELAPSEGWIPRIEITTRRASGKDGRPFLQLSVSDNGSGMSEETRQRVFQPFFTTKGPRKGTGLGLAAVWSFVESMEGFIELESREGQGTTFRIHLPWRPDSSAAETTVPAAPTPPPMRRDHRVLYVEDDDYVAGAILSFLSRNGLSVERAVDGLAGLHAVLDRGPWDLVLTDLNMPNFSGLDLVRELRKRNYPGKVAVITGMLSREHEAELRSLEIDTFLPKPVMPHTLIEKVWELVNPAGGAWDI